MVDQPADGVYPEYWEADVVLRDGGTAHLRPIHPSDADAVQAFHVGQSQKSIYMRFFAFKSKLSAKELKRFTEVDYKDRVALVITIGGEIMGIGRYDRLDDPEEAEVAFNISDAHQGRGIGSILLEHLAAAARENGIRKFSAEVLPENRKMLMVFSDAGYDVKRHFDDGVVSLEFNIDPTDKSRAVMESREHRAEARSIQELLAPSSVAVIGASRKWGTVGYQLLEHIIEGGFTGPVYAINPEAFELAGMLSFARLSEVPGPVKLAIIAVPYAEVPKVVEECGAAGVKGIVVATAGYADDGERGLARQRELVRQARANGMRVIGPASLGIMNTNPAVSLNASMAPSLGRRGGLGLFSQSAAIGVSLYAASSRRRVGISTFLSAGNRADVSGNDMMQYWEDDADTTAVGLYLESIGNPRKFSRLARRLARTKPVIVAKSDAMGLGLPPGHAVRTTQAPPEALDAMMRQAGVIRVETIEQLMDVAQIVSSQPLPKGPGIAVFSNSRALGKVVADSAAAQGLGVERIVTDVDLDAGMSVALPALRHSLQEVLTADTVHAVVVALLPGPRPHRGKDRRGARRMFGGGRQTRGGGVQRPAGPVHLCGGNGGRRGRVNGCSLLLQPRRGQWPRWDPWSATPSGWTGTRACLWNPRAATRTAPTTSWNACWTRWAASSFVRLDAGDGRGPAGPLRHPGGPVRRLRHRRRGRRRRGPARLAGGAEDHRPRAAAPAGPRRGAPGHPGRGLAAAERAGNAQVAGTLRLAVAGSADHGAGGPGLHVPRHRGPAAGPGGFLRPGR